MDQTALSAYACQDMADRLCTACHWILSRTSSFRHWHSRSSSHRIVALCEVSIVWLFQCFSSVCRQSYQSVRLQRGSCQLSSLMTNEHQSCFYYSPPLLSFSSVHTSSQALQLSGFVARLVSLTAKLQHDSTCNLV